MSAPQIAVATGAGISAESGVPTFRGPDGLWHGRRPEEVATPEAFLADPADVWDFYLARRKDLSSLQPNAGHRAIASWSERFGACPVITQNIDGLHQAAGSPDVLELHGSIWRRHCHWCGCSEEDQACAAEPSMPPRCGCGGPMRPSVVWFGEALPEDIFEQAREIAGSVKVLVVVGTSNLVYPAASIPLVALSHGATVIEVNPAPTSLSNRADRFIQGRAGEILPTLNEELERLLA